MTHCYYNDRRKRYKGILATATITALLVAAIMIAILWGAWHGMNKELCARNLSPSDYASMQLDCSQYK